MTGLFRGNSEALKTSLFERYILNGGNGVCDRAVEKNNNAPEIKHKTIFEDEKKGLFMISI
jgi:hypothetical protein